MALKDMEKHYFRHDFYARHDEKLKRLRIRYGMAGIGMFWSITEMLYENNGSLELDYEIIADELRCDTDIVKSVINDFGLFSIDNNMVRSNRVDSELKTINEKSEKAKKSIEARWKNTNVHNNNTSVQNNDTNVEQKTQIKIQANNERITNEQKNIKDTIQANNERNTSEQKNDTSVIHIREDKIREDKIKNNNSLSLSPSLSGKGGEATEKERIFLNVYYQFFLLNRKNPEAETNRFIDHYSSQDWRKSNGQKITNVAAAVRLWKCEDMEARFPKKFVDFVSELIEKTEMKKRTAFVSMIVSFRYSEADSQYVLRCKKPIYDFIESHGAIAGEIARKKFGEQFKMGYEIIKNQE